MNLDDKQQRELLNKAWEKGLRYYIGYWRPRRVREMQRDEDVSKILKEAEEQRKDGRDE